MSKNIVLINKVRQFNLVKNKKMTKLNGQMTKLRTTFLKHKNI